jgi:hypothetical protein
MKKEIRIDIEVDDEQELCCSIKCPYLRTVSCDDTDCQKFTEIMGIVQSLKRNKETNKPIRCPMCLYSQLGDKLFVLCDEVEGTILASSMSKEYLGKKAQELSKSPFEPPAIMFIHEYREVDTAKENQLEEGDKSENNN